MGLGTGLLLGSKAKVDVQNCLSANTVFQGINFSGECGVLSSSAIRLVNNTI